MPKDPQINLGRFHFRPASIAMDGRPPLAEWKGPLQFALWCQRASPWWIGDLINAGEDIFGEEFAAISAARSRPKWSAATPRSPAACPRAIAAPSSPGRPTPPSPGWRTTSSAACSPWPRRKAGTATTCRRKSASWSPSQEQGVTRYGVLVACTTPTLHSHDKSNALLARRTRPHRPDHDASAASSRAPWDSPRACSACRCWCSAASRCSTPR